MAIEQIKQQETPTLADIQQENLNRLQSMQDPHHTYGEKPFRPGGRYLVDIFDDNQAALVIGETHKIFNRKSMRQSFQMVGAEVKIYNTPNEERYAVFNKRVNIHEYPIPLNNYIGQPYIYNTSKDPNIVSAEYAYTPSLVLAEATVQGEQWFYVRTNTVGGWVKEDEEVITTGVTKEDILFDPLRPQTTTEKFNGSLGIITAHGLKIEENRLVPANPFLANANIRGREEFESLDDWSEYLYTIKTEIFGDGIIEEGESAILSIGNPVKIVSFNESTNDYLVELPSGQRFEVAAEYLNEGFLEPTQENILTLLQKINGKPYSWGDEDGINYDCSGMMKVLHSAFGILLPRGGDAQRYGPEGKQFTIAQRNSDSDDYRDFLPLSITDLENAGVPLEKVRWGFTTVSWGTHVMLLAGFDDKTGEIYYAHSVAPMKDMRSDINVSSYSALQLWRVVVGPASTTAKMLARAYKVLRRFNNGLPDNTFSPNLPRRSFRERFTEVDRSYLSLVVNL